MIVLLLELVMSVVMIPISLVLAALDAYTFYGGYWIRRHPDKTFVMCAGFVGALCVLAFLRERPHPFSLTYSSGFDAMALFALPGRAGRFLLRLLHRLDNRIRPNDTKDLVRYTLELRELARLIHKNPGERKESER